MANGHGGRRAGAGRKPDPDAASLRRAARELCASRLKELGRLALKAENERVRTAAFDRLFRIAYGSKVKAAIPDDSGGKGYGSEEPEPIEWATDPADAIPDPARR
jgi:hypothetical protein